MWLQSFFDEDLQQRISSGQSDSILFAVVTAKVSIVSNVKSVMPSATVTEKMDWRFECFGYCLPFCTGLINTLTSVCLKCLRWFAPQSTQSNPFLCAIFKLFRGYSSVGNVGLDAVLKSLNFLLSFYFP